MYEYFERLLQARGVTAYQVSKATGISSSTLSSWKTRGTRPSAKTLEKLANYFNVSADYFINGSDTWEAVPEPLSIEMQIQNGVRNGISLRDQAIAAIYSDCFLGDGSLARLVCYAGENDNMMRRLLTYATKLKGRDKEIVDMILDSEDDHPQKTS